MATDPSHRTYGRRRVRRMRPVTPSQPSSPASAWSWPHSALAWLAVVVALVPAAFGAAIPRIHSFFNTRYCRGGGWGCVGGQELVTVALVAALGASALGLYVVVRRRERSLLVLASLLPALLIGVFWAIFALGEVIAPH